MPSETDAGSIEIVRMTAADHDAYSVFLAGMPQAMLYGSLPYLRFLEAMVGCPADVWLACRSGRIIGALPLMERNGPHGRVINSLPYFGSNGGILASTPAAAQRLLTHYDAIVSDTGVAAATWISNPLLDVPPLPLRYDLTDQRIGQFTDLTGSEAELLARFDGSARRNIKKAQSSGVTVRIDNASFGFLERVHRDNMAEIGGNAKAPAFFSELPKQFEAGRGFRIYVAERAGQDVAALLLLYFGRTIEYFTPVTVAEERVHQPMAAILHKAMCDGIAEGRMLWNWGGTWESQTGVWRFKNKWGAQDRRYTYYIKLNNSALLDESPAQLLAAYPGFYVVPFNVKVAA